jgi:ribosome production factor 1
MREYDPSTLTANPDALSTEAGDTTGGSDRKMDPRAEANVDMDNDPFASYFNSDSDPSVPPKVLITTSPQATRTTYDFCDELVGIFPGAEFIRRKKGKGFEIGVIAGWAAGRGYGAMVVVNEDMKKPSELPSSLPGACLSVIQMVLR